MIVQHEIFLEAIKKERVISTEFFREYDNDDDNLLEAIEEFQEDENAVNYNIKELKEDINENKTELIILLMIMAALYEFMYMHKIPIKVVISEYLKASTFFVEDPQKNFLNAILDKVSKVSRVKNE